MTQTQILICWIQSKHLTAKSLNQNWGIQLWLMLLLRAPGPELPAAISIRRDPIPADFCECPCMLLCAGAKGLPVKALIQKKKRDSSCPVLHTMLRFIFPSPFCLWTSPELQLPSVPPPPQCLYNQWYSPHYLGITEQIRGNYDKKINWPKSSRSLNVKFKSLNCILYVVRRSLTIMLSLN